MFPSPSTTTTTVATKFQHEFGEDKPHESSLQWSSSIVGIREAISHPIGWWGLRLLPTLACETLWRLPDPSPFIHSQEHSIKSPQGVSQPPREREEDFSDVSSFLEQCSCLDKQNVFFGAQKTKTPRETNFKFSFSTFFFVTEMTSISVQGKHLNGKEMKDRKERRGKKISVKGKSQEIHPCSLFLWRSHWLMFW